MPYFCNSSIFNDCFMNKLLLLIVGVVSMVQLAWATTCPGATAIPGLPTFPYTQAVTCGGTNDITAANAVVCGSTNYYGGQEALYVWTPTETMASVSIAYTGQTWSGIFIYQGCPTSGGTCVANVTGSASSKTLNVPVVLNAGTTYYIMFDTWPTPNSPCPGSFTINATPIVAPPTPTQDVAPPTCPTGTNLTVSGTPGANETWYWQTTASGTSTATPYAGPYNVFLNGTYYIRTFNSVVNGWSVASSYTVSNIPVALDPPAPTADVNPSCAPAGSNLSVAAAPGGYAYYWQGTNAAGVSTALDASSSYNATASGTYYVKAYETATQCWSNPVGIAVSVDTYIPPAPIITADPVNACTNAVSAQVAATPSATSGTEILTLGTNYVINPGAVVTLSGNLNIPAGATITSSTLTFNNVTTLSGTWPSDISIDMNGASTLGTTTVAAVNMVVTNASTGPCLPYRHRGRPETHQNR